jgi:tetratricopeptide (TPR) repeat protein
MQGALIRRAIVVCPMLLGLMLAATPADAQTGQVKGKVVDSKDQPVEGATVVIEATDGMGRKFTVKTNRRGEYIQIGLQPGQYKITAQKDNLSDSRQQRVSLDMAEVNLKLMPGGAGGEASPEERKKAEARIAAINANFQAGVAASNAGNFDEAIAKFTAVLAEAPKCVECYLNIAAVHSQKKEYDQAEGVYKKAIELSPNSFEAYSGLANIYNAQKKFDLAAEASAQAQKLGAAAPGGASASAVFNQGVIAWNANKFPEAKQAFEQAVKLDPKLADAHYWLGMANVNQGNVADAAKSFEEYLKLAPTGQYAEQAKGILSQIKK